MSYHVNQYDFHCRCSNWHQISQEIQKRGFSMRNCNEVSNGHWYVTKPNDKFDVIEIVRIDDEYSWSEICNNADNAPYLSPELKAKDEARYQANQYAMEHGEPDADSFDNPEEQIEFYCDKFNMFFDINGNLINE